MILSFSLDELIGYEDGKKTIHIRYVSTKKKKGQIIIILGAKRMANVTCRLWSFIFILGVYRTTEHQSTLLYRRRRRRRTPPPDCTAH